MLLTPPSSSGDFENKTECCHFPVITLIVKNGICCQHTNGLWLNLEPLIGSLNKCAIVTCCWVNETQQQILLIPMGHWRYSSTECYLGAFRGPLLVELDVIFFFLAFPVPSFSPLLSFLKVAAARCFVLAEDVDYRFVGTIMSFPRSCFGDWSGWTSFSSPISVRFQEWWTWRYLVPYQTSMESTWCSQNILWYS